MKLREGYSIPPKPTPYGRYDFRSKLEARWAVFMDLLGVDYEYEPRCAEVETGCRLYRYMPDFYIPALEFYIEIKPRKPTKEELGKAAAWAKHEDDIIIFYNFGPEGGNLLYSARGMPTLSSHTWHWSQCPRCLMVGLNDGGELRCGCYTTEELLGTHEKIDFTRTPNILKAFQVARAFDFTKTKRVTPLHQVLTLI